MEEYEDIALYFFQVENIVNSIVGFDEEVLDIYVVWNLLRSLSSKLNPKVSTLEETSEVGNISVDKIHGTLSTYELRIKEDKSWVMEATFKVEKEERSKKMKDTLTLMKNKPSFSKSWREDLTVQR